MNWKLFEDLNKSGEILDPAGILLAIADLISELLQGTGIFLYIYLYISKGET